VGQSPEGPALVDQLADDVLVKGLLLLYNLHPIPVEVRVDNALAKVRPYLGTHGGNVEVLSLEEGVLRLKLQGSCHGCQSSAVTLKLAIEAALNEAAPDLSAIEVEGVVEPAPRPAAPGFIPLTAVRPVPVRVEGPRFEACPTELEPIVVAP
jgi:Fe-S cluster biogenesis protein NfuA